MSYSPLPAAFLLLLLRAAALPSDCSFPINMNGTEVWGLHSFPAATDAPSCAAACCANSTCTLFQFCLPGYDCSPANACWLGSLGGQTAPVSGWVSARRPTPRGPLIVDASAPAPRPVPVPGNIPPVARADGSTLGVTSGGFVLDGEPFFAVAGEMHYSRVDAASWAPTLRAMRAGGLTTVSTYVIMIHHNEVEGVYDWTGARNLTAFVLAARDAGLLVSLRIGPYAHGEVRGGGLPDWLQNVPGISLRSTQPLFLNYSAAWYAAVAAQIKALTWQEGGPIITIQLDNETGDGAYLTALRAIAVAVGMNPPFFVSTGLNAGAEDMLPLTGMYPVAFWDGRSNATSDDYLFKLPDYAGSGYPTLWCELGAGIVSVYCNRHRIAPMDIVASAYVALARSSDLGYYMYTGGVNPLGALSTLQERQAFYNGIWDLTVATYDFVAPIGASGVPHAQYHSLRLLHSLASTLTNWLPVAAVVLPNAVPSGADDADTLRWAARSDGNGSALLVISTFARNLQMSPQTATRLTVLLPHNVSLQVPSAASPAVDLPDGSAFAWPIYMPLPGALRMAYALAQPAGVVHAASGPVVLLHAQPGVATELKFDGAASLTVAQCVGTCTVEGDALFARGLRAGRGAALTLVTNDTTRVSFVVLSPDDALRLYVGRVAGAQRAILLSAPADAEGNDGALLEFDADVAGAAGLGTLRVRTRDDGGASVSVSMLPPPSRLQRADGSALPQAPDGVFTAFDLGPTPPCAVTAAVRSVSPGDVPPPPKIGARGQPVAPGNDGTLSDAWSAAAVWGVTVDGVLDAAVDVRLIFNYTGDTARLYASPADDAPVEALVGDSFFNFATTLQTLWTVSLSRRLPALALPAELTLRIIPLRGDSSAVVGLDEWPSTFNTGPGGTALSVDDVAVVCTRTTELSVVA